MTEKVRVNKVPAVIHPETLEIIEGQYIVRFGDNYSESRIAESLEHIYERFGKENVEMLEVVGSSPEPYIFNMKAATSIDPSDYKSCLRIVADKPLLRNKTILSKMTDEQKHGIALTLGLSLLDGLTKFDIKLEE